MTLLIGLRALGQPGSGYAGDITRTHVGARVATAAAARVERTRPATIVPPRRDS